DGESRHEPEAAPDQQRCAEERAMKSPLHEDVGLVFESLEVMIEDLGPVTCAGEKRGRDVERQQDLAGLVSREERRDDRGKHQHRSYANGQIRKARVEKNSNR